MTVQDEDIFVAVKATLWNGFSRWSVMESEVSSHIFLFPHEPAFTKAGIDAQIVPVEQFNLNSGASVSQCEETQLFPYNEMPDSSLDSAFMSF